MFIPSSIPSPDVIGGRPTRPVPTGSARWLAGFLLLGALLGSTAFAQDKPVSPQRVKHQITGLFAPERVEDLRAVFEELAGFRLISVDFKTAEAIVEYDPKQVFPGAKPDQIVQRFDQMLRQATHSTFGVKPLRSVPVEKLKLVEIPAAGLDCKACCLGAYEAIYRLKGVERATASFREGRITALIDPELIDRAELEKALKQRGVQLTPGR